MMDDKDIREVVTDLLKALKDGRFQIGKGDRSLTQREISLLQAELKALDEAVAFKKKMLDSSKS